MHISTGSWFLFQFLYPSNRRFDLNGNARSQTVTQFSVILKSTWGMTGNIGNISSRSIVIRYAIAKQLLSCNKYIQVIGQLCFHVLYKLQHMIVNVYQIIKTLNVPKSCTYKEVSHYYYVRYFYHRTPVGISAPNGSAQ